MARPRRLLAWFGIGAGTAFSLWLGGLLWFVHTGLTQATDQTTPSDAIVVLTGGRLRVESGLDLLEAGTARKLFVSGVNQHVDREALLRVFGPLPESASCCIVLGHDADNTLGNARETAEWMRHEGYRSLRLVTSWYHMPRSVLEFEREMPEIRIIAHPVFISRPGGERWWAHPRSGLPVVHEYDKYLVALWRPAIAPIWSPSPGLEPREDAVTRAAGQRP